MIKSDKINQKEQIKICNFVFGIFYFSHFLFYIVSPRVGIQHLYIYILKVIDLIDIILLTNLACKSKIFLTKICTTGR